MVDYRGITIEIEGNATQLSKTLQGIREDAKYVTSGLVEVNKSLKFDDGNVTLLAQKQEYLAKSIEIAHSKAEAYRAGLSALSKTIEENGELDAKQQAQYDQLQRSLISTERQAASYERQLEEITKAQDEQARSTGDLSQRMSDLGDRMTATGECLKTIGDAATVGLTLPLVAGTKQAVDAAVELDTAFHDLTKTADGTDAEMQKLKDSAIALSETQPVSAAELLQIEGMGAQLGYANDKLEGFAQTIAGMSVSTDMGVEEAATSVAQFSNIMGTAQEDTSRFGSTVIALGNNFAATESKTSDMALRLAAAGKQVGMSEADVLGLSTALVAMGVNAESGGSNVSKIMSQIDKDVALSSDNVQAWAQAAGMSAEAFAQAWRSDPVSALQALFGGMESAVSEGSNLSAILEDLGIKSSQATDVAKRLSSNSELLGDAVRTANEAWRENVALTDEVNSRNDSLASRLDVLRNKAQNVLAEVGEPIAEALIDLLDAAQPLFDLIKSGAQAFADMDEGAQKLVVTAGVLAAAFGPVNSMIGRTIEAAGGVIPAFGEIGDAIGMFKLGMSEGEGVVTSLSLATEGLSGVLSTALAGVGIGLAVNAVGMLVGALQDWQQHQEDVKDATSGLTSAMDAMDEAAGRYLEGIEGASERTGDLRDRIDEVIQKQAELARTMRDEWADVGSEGAAVDRYVDQIAELSAKSQLSKEDVAVLTNAVGQLNEKTGASISVLDEQTGKLSLSADQIREVAEAWARKEQAQQHEKDFNALLERQAEAHAALEEAERRGLSAMDELGGRTDEYLKTLGTMPSATSAANQSLSELRGAVAEADAAVEQAKAGMSDSGYTFSTVEAALASTGVSIEDLASLTAEQMAAIRSAFDGTAKSAAEAFEKIRQAARNSASTAGAIGSSGGSYANSDEYRALKEASDARYREQQRAYEDEATALSRHLDQIYTQRSKEYQAEYDLQKSELDKQLENLKSALDSEYQSQKSYYDSVYQEQRDQLGKQLAELRDQLGKQLAAQRDAYKKQLDSYKSSLDKRVQAARDANAKTLAARKAADSAEETQLSKSLDALYRARQKQIQKEYKEYQKQSQKRLKEAKAANAAETKDFKSATDQRIAAIKAEYAERRKALETNSGAGDIDAQIKALQDQTKAEQAEIKKREQEKKVSELRSAVQQAQTRRTRQDAEAALSEYLDELAQEARESERERQIEQLQDQKARIEEEVKAEQGKLDAERDQRIESYRQQRDDELTALQERQDEAYELLSEKLGEQAELVSEHNSEVLQSYRDQLNLQLEAMRERHASEQEALAESLSAQVEQLRANNEQQLAALSEWQAADLERITAHNESVIAETTEANNAALAQTKAANDAALAELSTANKAAIDGQKAYNDSVLAGMKDAQSNALADMKTAHQDQISNLKRSQSDALAEMRAAQSSALSDLKSNLGKGNAELSRGMSAAVTETDRKSADMRAAFAANTSKMSDDAGTNGTNAGKTLWQRLDEQKKHLGDTAENLRTQARDKLSPLVPDFRTIGQNAVTGRDGLNSGLESKRADLKNKTESLSGTAKTGLAARLNEANGVGSNMAGNFVSGIGSKSTSAYNTAQDVAVTARNAMGSVSASTTGNNFVVGFINGMNGVDIWSYAWNIGMSALDAIKSALGIASPSKKAMEVGRYFVQGAEVGVDQERERLIRRVAQISDDMTDALTPTLDLSELQRQAERQMSKQRWVTERARRANEASQRAEVQRLYIENAATAARQTPTVQVIFNNPVVRDELDFRRIEQMVNAGMRRAQEAMV